MLRLEKLTSLAESIGGGDINLTLLLFVSKSGKRSRVQIEGYSLARISAPCKTFL